MNSKDFYKLHAGDTVTFTGSERLPDHAGCDAKIISINHRAGMATILFEDSTRAFVTRDQVEAK